MHKAEVSVVLDSISEQGNRLTTFQLRYWRPIHAEVLTHRVFSRNAGSSRARPSAAIIEQVRKDPWGPLHWGKNQPGMQAEKELDHLNRDIAMLAWQNAACAAADQAEELVQIGAHKQIVNRLLEPFTYIDVVVSSTSFNNWFALRNHPDAQPEIKDLAEQMFNAIQASTPRLLEHGQWHLPYFREEDMPLVINYWEQHNGNMRDLDGMVDVAKKISVARCARVSYKAFDGNPSPIEKDIELFDKLVAGEPLHASPTEHIASPDQLQDDGEGYIDWMNKPLWGNLSGWIQYRKTFPNEFVPG